jgi:NADPH:quinone reductase-like Zn-dependent oxidoreductase
MNSEKYGTGSVSEYALITETLVISKPKNLNFVEAASIPLVALTAIQMFDKVPGGVDRKTVFIPAGRKCFLFLVDRNEKLTLCCREVSGVGSVAAQMAKNAYGAGKVITTVSTTKLSMVGDLLGKGVVDESELS